MEALTIGSWVKGPFLDATIEGFIVKETENDYMFAITKVIDDLKESPSSLEVGSVKVLPKFVVSEFYTVFDRASQLGIIELSMNLGQDDWTNELIGKFSQDVRIINKTSCAGNGCCLYSKFLKQKVCLTMAQKERLVDYYLATLPPGAEPRISKPEDIVCGSDMDGLLMLVVLHSTSNEEIKFIQSLS